MYDAPKPAHFEYRIAGVLDERSLESLKARWRVARILECDMLLLKPSDSDHVKFVLETINAKLPAGHRVDLKPEYKEKLCPRKN